MEMQEENKAALTLGHMIFLTTGQQLEQPGMLIHKTVPSRVPSVIQVHKIPYRKERIQLLVEDVTIGLSNYLSLFQEEQFQRLFTDTQE